MTVSFTQAKKEVVKLGLTMRRVDGEIRLSWPNNESAAYYTDCIEDALGTARCMAKESAPQADMVTTQDYDTGANVEVEIASLVIIGTYDGETYYEHPKYGDEAPLQIIVDGELEGSDFWDMDSIRNYNPNALLTDANNGSRNTGDRS